MQSNAISPEVVETGEGQMRSKSQAAWETAARCTTLTHEAEDPQEREHYARLRDAWITLAKRSEPFNFPDVTDLEKRRAAICALMSTRPSVMGPVMSSLPE